MKISSSFFLKTVGGLLVLLAISLLSILLIRALDARKFPDLEPWHKGDDWGDNLTQREYKSFEDYLETERAFLDSIYQEVKAEDKETFCRYNPASDSTPYVNGSNQNGSFHESPEDGDIKGGILLIHGLTDSPYHMRSIAKIFAQNGYYVVCLRLPGHGTTPGALKKIRWEDWYGAVQFGARMVRKQIADIDGGRFFVGGFSTGGALTLRYVLDALISNDNIAPNRLFLFSPAIGVSPFATFADWHCLISWMPPFQKFRWRSIKPEYDPFKYNSFPKNAADQVYELTKANEKLVGRLVSDAEKLSEMPHIHAFQSIVDATVITEKLIDLFAKIGNEQSELVLFDVNRKYKDFFKSKVRSLKPEDILSRQEFKSRLFVITNRNDETNSEKNRVAVYQVIKQVDLEQTALREEPSTEHLHWPDNFFALSHVCIPISPEDKYYGKDSKLGTLNAKGEKRVLLIGDSDLMRIRYNPFFSVIEDRIKVGISSDVESQ
jgi:alpha-beta hydrolase superfamily lysophospholipase